MNYTEYTDGETGIVFTVFYNNNEIESVMLDDNDLLPLLSEEVVFSIQLWLETI